MSLEKFISHVKQVGFNTTSRFEVVIPNGSDKITLLCNASQLPGVNIMTNEIRYFGENLERPHGIVYPPIQLSFYIDNDLTAKKFFDSWSNAVFNRSSRVVGFYESYVKDIIINLLDKNGKALSSVRLVEAYPKSVGDIALDTSNVGMQVFNVTLVYKWWEQMIGEELSMPPNVGTGIQLPPTAFGFETLGNQTFFTADGSGTFNNPFTLSMGSDAYSGLMGTGTFILSDSSRLLSQSSSLFGASSVTGGIALADNSTVMGSGFFDFGNSLKGMAESLSNIAAPVMSASTAIGTIAGTVGSLGGLVGALGGDASKFSNIANKLSQSAGTLQTVSQLNGLPGHLQSVAANMGSVSAAINETISEVKLANNTFDAPAQKAFSNISTVFNGVSSSVGSVSTLIAGL